MSKIAKFWLSKSIFYVKNDLNLSIYFLLKNIILWAQFLLLTFFDNFYSTDHKTAMGWLLVLGLKESTVECATVCVKSEVILLPMYLVHRFLVSLKCTRVHLLGTVLWGCFALWQYRLWSFKIGDTKLCLPKSEGSQMILWYIFYKTNFFKLEINEKIPIIKTAILI